MITHDWDTSDTAKELEEAFFEYRMACYGDATLDATQLKEVRQAFLSGIHWLNSRDDYCPADNARALRELLGQ